MRCHLPALDHGGMDPAPAPYMIRIKGHLGATMLSAFPALAPQHHGAHTVAGPAAADGPLQCAAVQVAGQQLSVAATRRTLARIEDLFSGHLPAPIELLFKVTQKRLPARSRLSVHDWFCGAPVARITLIR